jgi:hypothetical protein
VKANETFKFKARYAEMYGNSASAPSKKGKSVGRFNKLLRELRTDSDSDDTDRNDTPSASAASLEPKEPWSKEYNMYINTIDEIPEGMTITQWWGVSLTYYFSFYHMLTVFSPVDECASSTCVGVMGTRYPTNHGLFCL